MVRFDHQRLMICSEICSMKHMLDKYARFLGPQLDVKDREFCGGMRRVICSCEKFVIPKDPRVVLGGQRILGHLTSKKTHPPRTLP